MVEVNLVPDVKLELLKAQQQRRMVISGSIVLSIIAGGVVVLLALYAFGVQTGLNALADNAINDESQKLSQVEDLSKTLTIQKQLNQLDTDESQKGITSRLFDIVSATVPEGENSVDVESLGFDAEENTIEIEAEAVNGYEALEVFKKTIAETTFQFNRDGEPQDPVKIATAISDGERRYAENAEGQQVLRFSLSFTYADELFSSDSREGRIIGPNSQIATDSARGVPTSLFNGGSE